MTTHITNTDIIAQLRAHNIDPERVDTLLGRLHAGEISDNSFIIAKNRLRPPTENDYIAYETPNIEVTDEQLTDWKTHYGLALHSPLSHEDCRALGLAAIRAGELGLFWLNGGAATRYFNLKKVNAKERERFATELNALNSEAMAKPKGVTPVINDMTYLELKVRNLIRIEREAKTTAPIPVILMNSFITDNETTEHFKALYKKYPEIQRTQFHKVIQQPTIPRFTKTSTREAIDIYTDEQGEISFAPTGHGDFLTLLKNFFEHEGKNLDIRYLFFANIDNFGATIDPAILGIHIANKQGRTVELAPKAKGDKGGAPCFVDDKLIIVEQMKFPPDFDQDLITAFNTNTFWFTVSDLLAISTELPLIIAEKTVGNIEVLQLENFACDINLPSTFVNAPRERRFWPTKRYVDLLIYRDAHPNNDVERRQHEQFRALLKDEYDIAIE